jgi:hypothetical protein
VSTSEHNYITSAHTPIAPKFHKRLGTGLGEELSAAVEPSELRASRLGRGTRPSNMFRSTRGDAPSK